MKQVSQLYKTLRRQPGSSYEVQIVQGNNIYGMDKIVAGKEGTGLTILSPLTGNGAGLQIGNACSAECDVTILTSSANWPRMAAFTVQVRLVNGQQASEWITVGTFYTDERKEDEFGQLHIVAFDSMLKTERFWTDIIPSSIMPANWPVTAKAWCDMAEAAGLFSVDSRSPLDDTVAFIGLDTTSTAREVLQSIASAHGANWVVTSADKLRLVPYASMIDGSAAIAGIAIAGVSIVGDSIINIDDNIDYAFLGMDVGEFQSSPAFQSVTGVSLESENGIIAAAGNENGYVVSAPCSFASITGLADLSLSRISGYVYRPFEASDALLDPAAEVGDLVIINGKHYQMMNIQWNINSWPSAAISAPYDQEVNHEFAVVSESTKTYRKAMASTTERLKLYPTTVEMNSAIEQSEQSITLNVSQTYVPLTSYSQAIADLQRQIDGSVSSFSGADVPTLSNYPANEWTTASEKQQHVGSLYLVTSDSQSGQAGQYYRFEQSGENFAWVLVEDSALATALANAAAAQAAAEQAQEDADAAQTAADAAQGTADQARLDAVAQAAQAQAVAITQAAVDATYKANAALAEAKAYATAEISDFVTGEYADDLAAVQSQLDQKIETYYQSTDPSLAWPSQSKAEHTGDLWYDTTTELYFRWNGTAWEELTSNPPQGVFDRIDGKANVFVTQPNPPYKVGDIWTQGANGDILRCETARAEGEQFSINDWKLASKYTDDSALAQFLRGEFADTITALKQQLDEKAETFYQESDPSNGGHNWDTVAGRAIVGISIVGSSLDLHVGDMWYRTTDDKTFRWNGTEWEEQTISKEVFDTIDGKAQIFVGSNNPAPPYSVGDLWFIDNTSEILTSIADKSATETFARADWVKYNKYTDDAKANSVDADLQSYKETVTAELNVQSDNINAKVSKTGGNNSSFGWTLTDSDWSLYSKNTRVFRATENGIEIAGSGTFTGTVNATGGTFTGAVTAQNLIITGGEIDIGNGAFHVTNGGAVRASDLSISGGSISIGGTQSSPVFSVSPSGALTATNANITGEIHATSGSFSGDITGASGTFSGNLNGSTITGSTITGGSINIGNGAFVVDGNGNLTATSGRFTGEVLAKNIQAGGNAGYIQGSMIQTSTITGSLIAPTTITGANIQQGTITGSKIDSGTITGSNIQQSTITGSLIAPKTIGASLITDKSIQAELIADGSITTELIEEACITTDLIAEEAITEDLLHDNAVSGPKIQTSAITGSKVAPNTITGGSGGNIAQSTITGGDGGNIARNTITGGTSGNISGSTIKEFNVPGGEFSGSSLSSSINQSISYANNYNSATASGTSSYPPYFTAGRLISMSSVIADEMQIRSSASGEAGTTLSNHYHTIITNADGTITFGMPYNSSTPPSFRIADTKAYKDGVSAVKATSIDFTLTLSDDGTYYKVTADAKNQAGTVVKTSEVNTNRQPYINGQTAAKTQYEPTSIDFTQTLSDDGTYYTVTATAKNQAGTAVKTADTNTARQPYLNGQDTGAASATVSACSLSAAAELNYDSESGKWIATSTATITPRATYSDGDRNNPVVTMTGRSIDVTDVYNAGKSSARITDIVEDTSRTKTYGNGVMNIPVKATLATAGSQPFADTLENVDVSLAVNAGHDAGAKTAYVDGQYFDISSSPLQFSATTGMAKVHVNAYASSTLSNGSTYTNARPTLSSDYPLDCTYIYNQGKTDGAGSVSVDEITIFSQQYSNKEYNLTLRAFSNGTLRGTDTAPLIPTAAWNDAQNNVSVSSLSIGTSRGQITEFGLNDVWGDASTGIIHLYVPERVQVTKTSISGQSSSQWVTATTDVQITQIWAKAASDGIDAGVASVTVNQPNASGAPQYDEDEIRYSQYVTCTASNGKSNARTIYINAGTAYEHGYRIGYGEGQGSVSHSLWTSPSGGGQWNNANRRYEMTVYSCGGSFLVYSSNPFYRGDIW